VKLNSRSPKDVPVYDFNNKKLQHLIEQEIESIDKKNLTDNSETWAFVKATNKSMRVTNGKEAMHLLSRSTRIYEDLSKILQFRDDLFEVKLIFREWLDEVPEHPEMEFRGFVNQGKLNALTQYFCFAFSQTLADKKQEIGQRILDFFNTISNKIPHPSYIIDFFLLQNGNVIVIELNPFHIGAGAALFSWKDDRELFLNGPFEFRVTEKMPKDPKDILPIGWIKFLNAKYHPDLLEKNQPKEDEQENSRTYGCHII